MKIDIGGRTAELPSVEELLRALQRVEAGIRSLDELRNSSRTL